MDEVKIIKLSKLQVFSNPSKIETPNRTLSSSAGYCPTLPGLAQNSKYLNRNPLLDIVRPSQTVSGSPRTLSGF
jgi:hypothetical protein